MTQCEYDYHHGFLILCYAHMGHKYLCAYIMWDSVYLYIQGFCIYIYRIYMEWETIERKYLFISMFKINLHEIRIAIELFIYSWYLSGKNMSILQNYLWFWVSHLREYITHVQKNSIWWPILSICVYMSGVWYMIMNKKTQILSKKL